MKGHSISMKKIFNQGVLSEKDPMAAQEERSMDPGYSELLLCPIMSEPKNPRREHLSCFQINDGHWPR